MNLVNQVAVSEALQYALDNGVALGDVFPLGQQNYIDLVTEAKALFDAGDLELTETEELLVGLGIGETGTYNGVTVALNIPVPEEHSMNFTGYNKTEGESGRNFSVLVDVDGTVQKVDFVDTNELTCVGEEFRNVTAIDAIKAAAVGAEKTSQAYWEHALLAFVDQLAPVRVSKGSHIAHPYSDELLAGKGLPEGPVRRTYFVSSGVTLPWRQSINRRTITVMTQASGWKYQTTEGLPVEMVVGTPITIEPGTIHRFIKGDKDMICVIEDEIVDAGL